MKTITTFLMLLILDLKVIFLNTPITYYLMCIGFITVLAITICSLVDLIKDLKRKLKG